MAVPPDLALAHERVAVPALDRLLDPPADDEPRGAIADVHVLLLHARHLEPDQSLCARTVNIGARGAGRRKQDKGKEAGRTLFPSGESM